MTSKTSYDDQLLASAVRFLLDGGDNDAAKILLSCRIETIWEESYSEAYIRNFIIYGNRAAFDVLDNYENPISRQVRNVFFALLDRDEESLSYSIRAELIEVNPQWREELWQIAHGKVAHNQLAWKPSGEIHLWRGLRFNSKTEIRIAEALDKLGVLFFPNSLCRGGAAGNREQKEPDFLICYKSKWGILEVDGEPFHPASRAAEDHERDRFFKEFHGIKVIERFSASECFENADAVVKRFLKILENS